VLVGSFAHATDNPKTTIEIAIITAKKHKPDLAKFEKALKHQIVLKEIRKPRDLLAEISNGIVLRGSVNP
jgi:hypothetical protein